MVAAHSPVQPSALSHREKVSREHKTVFEEEMGEEEDPGGMRLPAVRGLHSQIFTSSTTFQFGSF